MSLYNSTSGELLSRTCLMLQPSCAERGVFVCNHGQSHIFVYTNEQRNRIVSNFTDMFMDRSAHDYRIKNVDSEIYAQGIVSDTFNAEAKSNTFTKDIAGNPRPGPEISIGAFELATVLEFVGSGIQSVKERKLRYDDVKNMFVAENGEEFARITGFIDGNPNDYAIEKKVFISIKPVENENIVTDKKYKVLYQFDALYESSSYTFVLYKTSKFNSGLFIRMIGKDQYIFLYDDITRTLTVGVLEKLNTGTSGYHSIINNVRFG